MLASHTPVLVAILAVVAIVSIAVAPRVRTADGFFRGWSDTGAAPGVLTLTLSQVTTWIFARSLLNAGILGYLYGISGALAYTAYYGSFLTGWLIVDRLRFVHGAGNVQSFLERHFGRAGAAAFNGLVSLRLLSEVFANLLVVGIVFGAAGSGSYAAAILGVAAVTLLYSMVGGLRASLRTDVLQTGLLLVLLAGLFAAMLGHPLFDAAAVLGSSPDPGGPGWVLLAVALLQVWSYPLHDPVMMDRGFIADRERTRRSFMHAFWISALCILAFGLLGVFAGLHASAGEELIATLSRLLGTPAAAALFLAPVIVFCIWGGRRVARASLAVAVAAALLGATLYFLETAGHSGLLAYLTGLEHKYSQLLVVTAAVLAVGFAAFALGLRRDHRAPAARP